MTTSVGVFLEADVLNHDEGPQDLINADGTTTSMPNNDIFGGGGRIEVELGIQEATFGRLELLNIRAGFGYTAQGQKYPTDVYAPAECDEYVTGGVGNVGSAGNCGVTGEAVDTSAAHFDRWGFDLRWQPRVWILPKFLDVSATVGVRFEGYTDAAQALQDGAYGMVDLKHRGLLFVVGGEAGLTLKQDLNSAGDLRLVGGYTYDTGTSYAEDTGGYKDPTIKGTGNHIGRLGVMLRL